MPAWDITFVPRSQFSSSTLYTKLYERAGHLPAYRVRSEVAAAGAAKRVQNVTGRARGQQVWR